MIKSNLNYKLLESICLIAIKAGKAVMEVYKEDFIVNEKKPNDPITKADLESHSIIKEALTNFLPDTHFFSEESEDISWEERKTWKTYWLVDPLDGTREFIKKNGEFTINIALVDNCKPVLGVIFAPCIPKIYFAANGIGAFFKKININDKNYFLESSSKLIINKINENHKILKIISGHSHKNNKKMEDWLNLQKKYELKYLGSSVKFCLIAEGKADIYPRFRPTSEWDIAAGHCILKEAGGNIKTFEGNEIMYNTKESLINPNFIASIE